MLNHEKTKENAQLKIERNEAKIVKDTTENVCKTGKNKTLTLKISPLDYNKLFFEITEEVSKMNVTNLQANADRFDKLYSFDFDLELKNPKNSFREKLLKNDHIRPVTIRTLYEESKLKMKR